MILETTFLIDLEREALAGQIGPAHGLLAGGQEALAVTWVTAGELACGPRVADQRAWADRLARFRLLLPDEETTWRYGRLVRFLQENGLLIETNDLWIAASALVHRLPVVTRNGAHFRRIPELEVVEY